MRKFIILIVLIISSCTNLPKKEDKKTPVFYSSETENEFSSIENQDSPYSDQAKEAAIRYQKMREQSWNDYVNKKNIPQKRIRKQNQYQTYKPKPVPKVKPLSSELKAELEVQSGQMMNYFCMKNRNHYDNNEVCSQYTEDILEKCKSLNSGEISKSVVRCLKSKLRV